MSAGLISPKAFVLAYPPTSPVKIGTPSTTTNGKVPDVIDPTPRIRITGA